MLQPINYSSNSPVILTVDTSSIAVGFYLCQTNPENPQKHYFAHFRSISLNEREQHFSQPKLELYGLFRTLRTYKIYIIGVWNLIIEVDARYIHGMLNNPNTALSASVNHWIVSILTFHFELCHVPGKIHGSDGLCHKIASPLTHFLHLTYSIIYIIRWTFQTWSTRTWLMYSYSDVTLITSLATHVTTYVATHGDSYLVDPRPYLVYKDPYRETCPSGLFSCAIQVISSKPDQTPFSPYCPQCSVGLRLIFSSLIVFQLHMQGDALLSLKHTTDPTD